MCTGERKPGAPGDHAPPAQSGSERFAVADESEMLALGASLAVRFQAGGVVYLRGELGAGKTTLVRGLLRGLGFEGRVKSPSFGLLESYALDGLAVHHLDLYRLGDAAELEFLGLEDLFDGRVLLLVEWAERGRGWLPDADLCITIEMAGSGRLVELIELEQEQQ